MNSYTVYFTDGSHFEFDAACDISAKQYAKYRADLRGTHINYVMDDKSNILSTNPGRKVMPTTKEPCKTMDEVKERFRREILVCLDKTTKQMFRNAKHVPTPGAKDADLPKLFDAIDKHTETLISRFAPHWKYYQGE